MSRSRSPSRRSPSIRAASPGSSTTRACWAIVHLVTLGWITASILGSLYIVGPIALRLWLPAGWLDYVAFALVVTGIVGMVAHFWLESYSAAWRGRLRP